MNIDFPLLLLLATALTGAIWLVDRLWLRPRRARALSRLEQRFPEGQRDDASYTSARRALEREPAWMEYGGSFFPVLAIVLVLRSFVVEPFQIPSGSMIPTLDVGDFILVNKFVYGLRLPVVRTEVMELGQPDRGDVMVFFPPHEERYFIKRVIGLPGDTIAYYDDRLYVNGNPVPRALVAQYPPRDPLIRRYQEALGGEVHRVQVYLDRPSPTGEWHVPAGHYFMMGDNRDRSDDSRRWGFVPEENIVGRAFAIWVHKAPGWHWPTFDRNRLIP